MRHVVTLNELNGHWVENEIASHSGVKSLVVITTVQEIANVSYRVYDKKNRFHHDYDSLNDALLAYNDI